MIAMVQHSIILYTKCIRQAATSMYYDIMHYDLYNV